MSGTRGASSESDGSDPPRFRTPIQNTGSEPPDQSPRIRAPGSEPPDQNLPVQNLTVQISSISVHFLAASASS